MTWFDESGRPSAVFVTIFLSFTFQGAYCELVVSPVGSNRVNSLAGSNVTLAVSFSGATAPAVTWFMGDLPVVTWIVGSIAPPDIAENMWKVVRLERNGSLTFVSVTVNYTGNYSIEMTKPGLGTAVTRFTLNVFENIQNVTLSAHPAFAQEGTDRFTLRYNMLQGVVEKQTWFFNGVELKSNSHYLVEQRSLVILKPNRSDAGLYTVLLTNPFSHVAAHMNVTVLYGPDEPILEANPSKYFYISGDSLSLSCHAEGFPQPTAEWVFGDQILTESQSGILNLTNVQTNQGGSYTCTLLNNQTKEQRQKSIILNVYERPPGNPMCFVQFMMNSSLQYVCQWPGGTPQATLSFPALSNTSSGTGNISVTVTASDNLNGKTVTCFADHPLEQNTCNITASSPVDFLPAVRSTVDSEDRIVVSIDCVSEALPAALALWTKGDEALTSGTLYQISNDTTQVQIRDYNISNLLLHNYTCTCYNPLGSQRKEVQLQGPSISDFNLYPNKDGTNVTLTWDIPSTSVVTGFFIQMMGPDLLNKSQNGTQSRGSSNSYRTIQQKPGTARSADISTLDPQLTYQFRIIPKAQMIEGVPSVVYRIGPDQGLSGPAIAGIAAGIPCSIVLLLLGSFFYLYIYCNKKKSGQPRYPASRAVDKAVKTQSDTHPNQKLPGGLKSPCDSKRLHQTPSERSVDLPKFIPPPPVRVATTV